MNLVLIVMCLSYYLKYFVLAIDITSEWVMYFVIFV